VAEEKQMTLAVEGDLQLVADPHLVEQAVGNLLSNAIKYTPPEGKIQIHLSEVRNGERETFGVINVQDNGFGIDESHLPHIFTRFYRGDPSRSRLITGDGLGLAIVKSIMDFHGGQVEVSSEPGRGSEFRLIFKC
jgi:signal transduction histidine kinase